MPSPIAPIYIALSHNMPASLPYTAGYIVSIHYSIVLSSSTSSCNFAPREQFFLFNYFKSIWLQKLYLSIADKCKL